MNSLMNDILLSKTGLTEEDYWKIILGLYYNSLPKYPETLNEIGEYYKTHNESVLGDEAVSIIEQWFRLK